MSSEVITIYEAQGFTSATVVVVKSDLVTLLFHDSVSHAYYSPCYRQGEDDAGKD